MRKGLEGLPQWNARVIKWFQFSWDGTVYEPPLGVEGSVSRIAGSYLFAPYQAIVNGQQVLVWVDAEYLELTPPPH